MYTDGRPGQLRPHRLKYARKAKSHSATRHCKESTHWMSVSLRDTGQLRSASIHRVRLEWRRRSRVVRTPRSHAALRITRRPLPHPLADGRSPYRPHRRAHRCTHRRCDARRAHTEGRIERALLDCVAPSIGASAADDAIRRAVFKFVEHDVKSRLTLPVRFGSIVKVSRGPPRVEEHTMCADSDRLVDRIHHCINRGEYISAQ
jgi:hypothetical protein